VNEIVPLGVAAIGALGSVVAAWVARQAVRNTRPLSNGFAGDITGRLTRIEDLIVNHINDHAQSNIKRKP
jgi:hypothetical protein